VSKAEERGHRADPRQIAIYGGIALVIAFAAGFAGRSFMQSGNRAPAQPRRPIVQIVRPQPGLPSLADTITRLCPSIASLIPGPVRQSSNQPQSAGAPAFVVSTDGWLVTSASVASATHLHAAFGDGRHVAISELRTDPVSGLAIAKVDAADLTPIVMADQAFPRVGDFGFGLQTPNANGCSAEIAMIASDFLADGGGPVSYVRSQSTGPAVPAGAPFLDSEGDAVAVSIADPAVPDAMIPSAIAGIIVDELIRGTPSPSIAFGFRATDFSSALADRLLDGRLRGAGVAIVQRGSPADKAGLHAGDVVVAVDSSPVSSASELGRALDAAKAKAALTVMRGDQRLTLSVHRTGS
jgi:serine protease DegQ